MKLLYTGLRQLGEYPFAYLLLLCENHENRSKFLNSLFFLLKTQNIPELKKAAVKRRSAENPQSDAKDTEETKETDETEVVEEAKEEQV